MTGEGKQFNSNDPNLEAENNLVVSKTETTQNNEKQSEETKETQPTPASNQSEKQQSVETLICPFCDEEMKEKNGIISHKNDVPCPVIFPTKISYNAVWRDKNKNSIPATEVITSKDIYDVLIITHNRLQALETKIANIEQKYQEEAITEEEEVINAASSLQDKIEQLEILVKSINDMNAKLRTSIIGALDTFDASETALKATRDHNTRVINLYPNIEKYYDDLHRFWESSLYSINYALHEKLEEESNEFSNKYQESLRNITENADSVMKSTTDKTKKELETVSEQFISQAKEVPINMPKVQIDFSYKMQFAPFCLALAFFFGFYFLVKFL